MAAPTQKGSRAVPRTDGERTEAGEHRALQTAAPPGRAGMDPESPPHDEAREPRARRPGPDKRRPADPVEGPTREEREFDRLAEARADDEGMTGPG
jgi:hypothetical protein